MSNCVEKKSNSHCSQVLSGTSNQVILIISLLCSHCMAMNYFRYGIIKNPIQLIRLFVHFLDVHSWAIFAVALSMLVQAVLVIIGEKFLFLVRACRILTPVAYLFQMSNLLLVMNVISVIFTYYIYSPGMALFLVITLFKFNFKYLSYILENRRHRIKYRYIKDPQSIYPANITLENLFYFTFCVDTFTYNIQGFIKKENDVNKAFRIILKIPLLFLTIAFLFSQYINPMVKEVEIHLDRGTYFPVIASGLQITVPVSCAFYLAFHAYFLDCVLPFSGLFSGTENFLFCNKPWSSQTISIYWRRWNTEAHLVLKKYIFLPILEAGYSRKTATFIVYLISGILHEYLITVPIRYYYGVGTIAMLLQIPLEYISTFIYHRYGPKFSNIFVNLFFMVGPTIYVIAACYHNLKVVN